MINRTDNYLEVHKQKSSLPHNLLRVAVIGINYSLEEIFKFGIETDLSVSISGMNTVAHAEVSLLGANTPINE